MSFKKKYPWIQLAGHAGMYAHAAEHRGLPGEIRRDWLCSDTESLKMVAAMLALYIISDRTELVYLTVMEIPWKS